MDSKLQGAEHARVLSPPPCLRSSAPLLPPSPRSHSLCSSVPPPLPPASSLPPFACSSIRAALIAAHLSLRCSRSQLLPASASGSCAELALFRLAACGTENAAEMNGFGTSTPSEIPVCGRIARFCDIFRSRKSQNRSIRPEIALQGRVQVPKPCNPAANCWAGARKSAAENAAGKRRPKDLNRIPLEIGEAVWCGGGGEFGGRHVSSR